MIKKISIIIIILLLLSSIAFLVVRFYPRSSSPEKINIPSKSPLISTNKTQDQKMIEAQLASVKNTAYSKEVKTIQDARTKKDISKCQDLKEISPDTCILEVAEGNYEYSLCKNIKDNTILNLCLDSEKNNNALRKDNPQLCLDIKNSEMVKACLQAIFSQKNDIIICSDFADVNKQLCQDLINKNIAYQAGNKEKCKLIIDKLFRDDCLNIVNVKLELLSGK
jgi:hypothetical protein